MTGLLGPGGHLSHRLQSHYDCCPGLGLHGMFDPSKAAYSRAALADHPCLQEAPDLKGALKLPLAMHTVHS